MQLDSVLDKLRSGYVPTPPEIQGVQTDVVSLTKELLRLETQIRDLSVQRESVRKNLLSHQALLSPVRRLPDDVVQDIFLACLPTDRNAVMSVREAPLLLCRVCSTWRALALATPILWASVHLHLGFILQSDSRTHAVVQWLQRSAACPLALSVSGLPAGAFDGAMDMTPILSDSRAQSHTILLGTLVQSAHRWRDIALTDLPHLYLQELRGLSTPVLQSIKINDYSVVTEWLNLLTAPKLRTLALQVEILEEHAHLLLPAISHITNLSISASNREWGTLNGVPANVGLGILTSFTQLVSLAIFFQDIHPATTDMVNLPVLESLTRGCALLVPFAHLLDHLIMPRLFHLAVRGQPGGSNDSLFATLAERSPLIRDLEIDLHGFTTRSLRGTLPHFPSLKKLVVGEWHPNPVARLADTEFLLTLLAESNQEIPILRQLEIMGCPGVEDEVLLRFLQARVDVGGPFRLRIDFAGYTLALPDVESFRSEGIDIVLVTHGQRVPPTVNPWSGLLRQNIGA
ncbi:hypothetical protein C8R43DRAFT_975599 [Mycena crocata]|nr:hypothetical protein C8R43DRAFT_975599 [Mycena crocata]